VFKSILCPTDGSEHANKALRLAVDLAKKYDARLVLVHVLLRNVDTRELKRFAETEGLTKTVAGEVSRLMEVDSRVEIVRLRDLTTIASSVLVDIGEHILSLAKFEADNCGVHDVSVTILDGDPAERILEHAEHEGTDCIVMGSRGLSDMKGLVLGSVSHKVNNRAACTCITVK
jgi:nucleotide-binding universal stress UspA family protein